MSSTLTTDSLAKWAQHSQLYSPQSASLYAPALFQLFSPQSLYSPQSEALCVCVCVCVLIVDKTISSPLYQLYSPQSEALYAVCCSVLQCVAVCCSVLHKVRHCICPVPHWGYVDIAWAVETVRTHCNTLQHTATHCNTPQHTRHTVRCLTVCTTSLFQQLTTISTTVSTISSTLTTISTKNSMSSRLTTFSHLTPPLYAPLAVWHFSV